MPHSAPPPELGTWKTELETWTRLGESKRGGIVNHFLYVGHRGYKTPIVFLVLFCVVPGYSKWVCKQACPKHPPPSSSQILSAAKGGREEGQTWKSQGIGQGGLSPRVCRRKSRNKPGEKSISEMPVVPGMMITDQIPSFLYPRHRTPDVPNIRWLPGKWQPWIN